MMLGCTKRELPYRMSASELQEWWIYYQMSPWGSERADIQFGMLSALMANMWSTKRGSRAKPVDFIPDYFEPHLRPPKQSAEEMYQKLLAFTRMVGGKVIEPTKADT